MSNKGYIKIIFYPLLETDFYEILMNANGNW